MNTVEYLKMEGREEGKAEGKVEGKAEGKAEGRVEAPSAFVESLLMNTGFTVEKIASLVNVSVEFVNRIQNKLFGSR